MHIRLSVLSLLVTLVSGVSPPRADLLYVSRVNDTITRIDTTTGIETVFANTYLRKPHEMAFDASDNLYVANTGDGTISRFSPGGVGSVFVDHGAVLGPHTYLGEPSGLAFDNAGNLFVSEEKIDRFTPGGVGPVLAHVGGYSLVRDSSGNFYTANFERL
jgi:DNA-binding beta-propeller fold protein YncE